MITIDISEFNSNEENLLELIEGLEDIRQAVSDMIEDLSENNQPEEALEILEDAAVQLGLISDSLDTAVLLIDQEEFEDSDEEEEDEGLLWAGIAYGDRNFPEDK